VIFDSARRNLILIKSALRWTCLASGLLALGPLQAQVATYKENLQRHHHQHELDAAGQRLPDGQRQRPDNTGTFVQRQRHAAVQGRAAHHHGPDRGRAADRRQRA